MGNVQGVKEAAEVSNRYQQSSDWSHPVSDKSHPEEVVGDAAVVGVGAGSEAEASVSADMALSFQKNNLTNQKQP